MQNISLLLLLFGLLNMTSCTESSPIKARTGNTKKAFSWAEPSNSFSHAAKQLNKKWSVQSFEVEVVNHTAADSSGFKLYCFWQTKSPLRKHTFQALASLSEKFPELKTFMLSKDFPELKSIDSHALKYISFCHDEGNQAAESVVLTSAPHCLLLDPSGFVCWEGHPQHLSPKIVSELQIIWQQR